MKTPISSDYSKAEAAGPAHVSKKCPECYHYLPLDARVCSSCGARVGKVDHYGMARKTTNWKSYVICVLAWAFLVVYVWWAFFRVP